ncbi:MAG: pyridoxal phosphate-dependent aminotransferase [Chromatiales bacterium]|nr:pyridoxal phosphate-dependent aminotransferase [Chromatiales bacterium]
MIKTESQRMAVVEDAVIPQVNALVRKHRGTISLGQGVVYYPPPPNVMRVAEKTMSDKAYHLYGPVAGLDELQTALAEKLKSKNNIVLNDEQCLYITAGANMAFNAVVLALCDVGDEIILLAPYYFNHKMTIEMCNCKAVIADTDADYYPVIAHIEAAITDKTRAVVSISPNNPSGRIYSAQTLSDINALCAEHQIYHISDEAYEEFVDQQHPHFSPGSLPDSAAHTISMFSFSKSYGLASWRIGYAVVPRTLETAIDKVQDNILICPPTICQFAALECLRSATDYIKAHIKQIAYNRQLCQQMLNELTHQEIITPPITEGALYTFVALQNRDCDFAMIEKLITDYQVAVIPGNAFGAHYKHCIRISYGALPATQLTVGLERLVNGLNRLGL